MRHDELHIILLILLISNFTPVRTSIDFTVEEGNPTKHHHHRHLHRLRHSRNIHHHPYISASSSIINPKNPGRLEQFSLNCPHVADASNKDVRIEVVWTLNETIWLKIENGERKHVHGESTFNKRRVSGKTVMRVLLNNARYLFDYDELTGDFSMEINPVLMAADLGAWQCHVTVWQPDGAQYTLTSRSRIRPQGAAEEKEPYNLVLNKKPEAVKNTKKMVLTGGRSQSQKKAAKKESEDDFAAEKRGDRSLGRESGQAAFSRLSDDRVYITRKDDETAQKSIIFARNDTPLKKPAQNSRFDAQIDYEIDMEDGLTWPDFREENLSKNRARSAQFYQHFGNSGISFNFSPIFLCFLLIFV